VRDPDNVTAASLSAFLAGLVIGLAIGFVLGPVVRYWQVWRLGVEVSREDDLTNRMQEHLLDELEHLLDKDSEIDDESVPKHRWSSGARRTRSLPGEPSQRFGRRRSLKRLGAEKPRT
jgi:hypothetical protein